MAGRQQIWSCISVDLLLTTWSSLSFPGGGLWPEISPLGAFTIQHLRRVPLREILRVFLARVTGALFSSLSCARLHCFSSASRGKARRSAPVSSPVSGKTCALDWKHDCPPVPRTASTGWEISLLPHRTSCLFRPLTHGARARSVRPGALGTYSPLHRTGRVFLVMFRVSTSIN